MEIGKKHVYCRQCKVLIALFRGIVMWHRLKNGFWCGQSGSRHERP